MFTTSFKFICFYETGSVRISTQLYIDNYTIAGLIKSANNGVLSQNLLINYQTKAQLEIFY